MKKKGRIEVVPWNNLLHSEGFEELDLIVVRILIGKAMQSFIDEGNCVDE